MKYEKLEKSQIKVTYTVTPEEFEKALDGAFDAKKKDIAVKGFRKGHVPRNIFEDNFGIESLFEDALNIVLNAKYFELYKEEELKDIVAKQVSPIAPRVEDNFARGQEFDVTLVFDVLPEFELPTYKGLSVKKAKTEATPEELEAAINADLEPKATEELKKEQVIANGDLVIFDYLGTVDGVAFDGGTAENASLTIGSGQFIPGFEAQMVGLKANEEADVKVTFPTPYQSADLEGKDAIFHVTIHEIKTKILPELNDEFVKTLGIEGIETVDAYKKDKKEKLDAQTASSDKDRMVNDIINLILDNTVVEMPQQLIEDGIKAYKANFEQQSKMYGIPLETLLGFYQMTVESFEKQAIEQGKRQSLFQVVFQKLIENESLLPSEEEIKAEAAKGAKDDAEAEKNYKDQRGQILDRMAYANVVDFLVENSIQE